MSLTLLSPPAAQPLSLSELKAHMRVTHDDEDAIIAALIASAVHALEARAGLAFLPQQWRLSLDAAPAAWTAQALSQSQSPSQSQSQFMALPIAPSTSVDEVAVIDADGARQAVDAHLYDFSPGAPGRLRATGPWPRPGREIDGVEITFTAGYADAAATPAPLKQAALMLAAHFYETRAAAREDRLYTVPHSVDALIAPYRQVRL